MPYINGKPYFGVVLLGSRFPFIELADYYSKLDRIDNDTNNNDTTTVDKTAVLGLAVLGCAVLGNNGIKEKLATPIIYIE